MGAEIPSKQMLGDLDYANVMCRIHYWWRLELLPDADETDKMGQLLETLLQHR